MDVALATLHEKERWLGPPLARVGVRVVTVPVDTDAFGTFSGEIPRCGSPAEVVVAKARAGMAASGLPIGIATEGSFGADPFIGMLPWHHELVAFVDDVHRQELILSQDSGVTPYGGVTVGARELPEAWLAHVGFPAQAVWVRPNRVEGAPEARKGLRELASVSEAIAAAARSEDGLALIHTDMRAHLCPSRQAVLNALGEALAARLACRCPRCQAPGYGPQGPALPRPCAACGAPTHAPAPPARGCAACAHQEVPAAPTPADPGHCPWCNP